MATKGLLLGITFAAVSMLRIDPTLAAAPLLLQEQPQAAPTPATDGGDDACFSVTQYGAAGDGVTDDTVAFQKAADAAAPTGGCVSVPPVELGKGYVVTGMVILGMGTSLIGKPAGLPAVPWCFGPSGGTIATTGGSRLFARPSASSYNNATRTGQPLFKVTKGCTVRGLVIIYDRMPFPTDAEFNNTGSEYYYPPSALEQANLARTADHFMRTKVPPIGPTFYVTEGTRVVIEDVAASRFRDFLYFETGGGQSHVRRIHGWGYGRFVSVEIAMDVFSFDTLRYVINAGPECFGPPPSADVCKQNPGIERCRGAFTVLPAVVGSYSGNVGLWLSRADGYTASDLFFFGVNTAVRLGVAARPQLNMTNPLTGAALTAAGAPEGSLGSGQGPWGNIRGLMVDQALVGIHMVWPNPLSNRFSDCQLHLSFWSGNVLAGDRAMSVGTGNITDVSDEAAVFVESTHTVANNVNLQPTTMFSNMVVASFNDRTNFGKLGAMLSESNGRAFTLAGDGLFEISQFAMNNERNAGTHLWAASAHAKMSLRIRGGIFNYTPGDDVAVAQNLGGGSDREEL